MNSVPPGQSCPSSLHLVCHPATALDCSGAWLFWPREISARLRPGLARLGQITPVLIDGGGARPVLVAGAARVACLAELGREVWCLDLGMLNDVDRGLAYLHSNLDLELTETRLVAALRYFAGRDGVEMERIFEAFGIASRSKQARLLLAWLVLPRPWDDALARGALPLACAELLAAFSVDDLRAVEPLFAQLCWSRGNAVNVLTWVREACLRDGLSVHEAMNAMDADETLRADLSPKDAMARLTQAARRLRYPELTRMEQEFEVDVAAMAVGTPWRIAQPDQFESGNVELCARVSSRDGLERAVRDLNDLASRAGWDALWDGDAR